MIDSHSPSPNWRRGWGMRELKPGIFSKNSSVVFSSVD